MKKIFAILFISIILIAPAVTFAQSSDAAATTTNPCSIKGAAPGTAALPRCINQIYVWSLGISVLLAMLMIVIGGYYLMTSGGNAEQATKGKEYITSALIGVVILFCAYLLLNEINPDLVNFNLDSLKSLNNSQPPTAPRQ